MNLTQIRRQWMSTSRMLFPIAVPVMFQSAAEYIFLFTDVAFVGQYDARGLSALNNVMAPFFTLLSFFFAMTQGVTILVSQKIGAGTVTDARRTAESSLFHLTVISWAMGVFWLVMARPVLQLMGAQGAVLDLGVQYVRLLSLQFLTLGLGATAGSIFQALGKTLPVMISVIIKCLLNVGLNWAFIFGHAGFPEMGVAGSALGTAVSSVLLDLALVALLFRGGLRRTFLLRIRGVLRARRRLFRSVLRLGLPVGAEFILWSLGQAILVAMVNRVDTVSSGRFGVLNVLMLLSIQVYNGIGVATLVLIGRATGARRRGEVRALSAIGLSYALLACVLVGLPFVLAPNQVLSLFLTDPSARQAVQPLMTLAAVTMFFKALNILAGNSLRGTGNTVWMLYTQIGGTILIVVVAAGLIWGAGWGLEALMIAVLVDELVRGFTNEAKFLRESRGD